MKEIGSPLFLQHRLITDLAIHWADPSHASHLGGCKMGPSLPANCLGTNVARGRARGARGIGRPGATRRGGGD